MTRRCPRNASGPTQPSHNPAAAATTTTHAADPPHRLPSRRRRWELADWTVAGHTGDPAGENKAAATCLSTTVQVVYSRGRTAEHWRTYRVVAAQLCPAPRENSTFTTTCGTTCSVSLTQANCKREKEAQAIPPNPRTDVVWAKFQCQFARTSLSAKTRPIGLSNCGRKTHQRSTWAADRGKTCTVWCAALHAVSTLNLLDGGTLTLPVVVT